MAAWNQSRIKMFRRCQKQYSFRYDMAAKMGLDASREMIPKRKKVQLYRGTWLHALIQALMLEWAEVGDVKTWQEVHEGFVEEFEGLFDEEKDELGDLPNDVMRLFSAYLRFWKEDTDRYSVAMDDDDPLIEFVVEESLKKYGIDQPFKGRIDLVVEDNELGGLWIWDHKSVGRIPSDDERMMSPQNAMYVWALRRAGYDIRGFVYNYMRTKAPAIPRVLRSGTLSMAQRMDTDYYTYVQAIKDLHGARWKEYAKAVYRGKLLQLRERDRLWFLRQAIPVETHKIQEALREFVITVRDIERRNQKYPPRSYFYSCRWNCEYHDLCVAEYAGLDIDDMVKHDFTFEDERYTEPEPDLMKE
jgi:hypothetical protein